MHLTNGGEMDQLTYVRGKLEEISKARGGVALVAHDTKIDRRTVRALLDPNHHANIGTINTLSAYFKKADKKAAKAGVQ